MKSMTAPAAWAPRPTKPPVFSVEIGNTASGRPAELFYTNTESWLVLTPGLSPQAQINYVRWALGEVESMLHNNIGHPGVAR